ncbi:MAG: FIG01147391: hypothetical protein [uncultured Sulfurovum sp.]|uniref:DUF2779 domain-containing protein n=1 Tax=uncultured Sulfurovum sp. TaxID=269237 RepID=A0A6S6T767_9BACT|nr:MAG: FIG01147391: hypothetical protein [uncultured Sulfurovum sp.]
MNLSKSHYTKGIQCPKALWLKKHKKEVLTPADELDKAKLETGSRVGELACQLFSNGAKVAYSPNTALMQSSTNAYLAQKLPYIYEATFEYQGLLVRVDILKVDDDGVSIYEVKSATSVKNIYLHDLSIQYYVLNNLGFTIKSTNIVYINNKYVKNGVLELEKLFVIKELSSEVEALQSNVSTHLQEFENYLTDNQNEPTIEIGRHCHKPYECDAKHYCWRVQAEIPEYSIFNIFNLGSKKQRELYGQGIVKIEDIPDDFAMTTNQARAVQNHKSQMTFIDQARIQTFCDALVYPIYHLDFEAFQQAIPEFDGIQPFEQIPFQYSLHIEHEDGCVEHREFLAKEGEDPRATVAQKLVENIPDHVTVLAYNMSFEKGVIKRLALDFEAYASHLLRINDNMKDLMHPFRKKWYSTAAMKGSYSIKYVLPALVPKLARAYEELDGVQDGSQAMNVFANLAKLEREEREKMRMSLLAYCKLDTLAMVEILGVLKRV